jgi:hypothetical protein
MSKLASPYRSRSGSPSESEGERHAATLDLRATTLQVEDFDHPTALQLAVSTGVTLVMGVAVGFGAALGLLLFAAAVTFVVRRRREITMSSVTIVIENGRLSLVRPGLDASVPLRELRSVGLAEEDEPGFAVVGHGLRAATLATSRGRAHIAPHAAHFAERMLRVDPEDSRLLESERLVSRRRGARVPRQRRRSRGRRRPGRRLTRPEDFVLPKVGSGGAPRAQSLAKIPGESPCTSARAREGWSGERERGSRRGPPAGRPGRRREHHAWARLLGGEGSTRRSPGWTGPSLCDGLAMVAASVA